MRDFQRRRVYAADDEISAGRWLSLDGTQAYVDKILRSQWWRKRCAIRKVDVSLNKGVWSWADRKSSYTGYIKFAPGVGYRERDILHELSHVYCTPSKDPDNSHGRHWAGAYYALTLRFRGQKAARGLVAG